MWVARERRFEKGHQPALRVAPVAHILAANLPVAQQVVLALVRDEHKGKVAWRVARHARELVNPAANATEAVKGGARLRVEDEEDEVGRTKVGQREPLERLTPRRVPNFELQRRQARRPHRRHRRLGANRWEDLTNPAAFAAAAANTTASTSQPTELLGTRHSTGAAAAHEPRGRAGGKGGDEGAFARARLSEHEDAEALGPEVEGLRRRGVQIAKQLRLSRRRVRAQEGFDPRKVRQLPK